MWETNQTSDVSVARISADGGSTFGSMLMLGMNGTTGETEKEGVGAGYECLFYFLACPDANFFPIPCCNANLTLLSADKVILINIRR